MKFHGTQVDGAWVIEPERRTDERGYFARAWCQREMAAKGLSTGIVQVNTAENPLAGTLRGMHFQEAPDSEVKIVRCERGQVFDVVVDLRPWSPTYCRWHGLELSADNGLALYVPQGCAHGYLTLADHSAITYSTSAFYSPDKASGVRFDDPAFGIIWPSAVRLISSADRSWPSYKLEESAT